MLASFSAERELEISFWDELKRNGFVVGPDLVVDRRGKPSPIARLDAAAAELVRSGPDAIVAWGAAAGHAAQSATKSVPIVVITDDPVESGLTTSMSRPSGNTTGVGILAGQLDGKRLKILHELSPAARRIGLLVDPTQVGEAEVEAVGRNLDLELIRREVRSADDVGQGIDALAARRVAAINVLASALFYDRSALIIERTRALGLPTIYWWPDLARAGGLIDFGANFEETNRLLARQVSRVPMAPHQRSCRSFSRPGSSSLSILRRRGHYSSSTCGRRWSGRAYRNFRSNYSNSIEVRSWYICDFQATPTNVC